MQLLRARLLERMELDRAEELGKERGEQKSASGDPRSAATSSTPTSG